jgi:hypothetical protein
MMNALLQYPFCGRGVVVLNRRRLRRVQEHLGRGVRASRWLAWVSVVIVEWLRVDTGAEWA